MHRSFLFSGLIAFCGGIVFAEYHSLPYELLLGAGGLFLVSWKQFRLVGIIVLFFVLGCWRWNQVITLHSNDVAGFINQNVTLHGVIQDPPSVQDGHQTILLNELAVGDRMLRQKMQIRLPSYPAFTVGSAVTVTCTLREFPTRNAVSMREHGIGADCQNPQVSNSTKAPPSIRITLGLVKAWVIERILNQFIDPQASLLIGVLLGRQASMPPDLTNAFRATGTTHMIALSGFNVTIILATISSVLIRVVGKRWAWIPGLILVVSFIVLSGASASVVRAGVMATVSMLAAWLGRPIAMIRLLSYTLFIMVWNNPIILVHDLGFQLSFLATVGLVFVAPSLTLLVRWMPERYALRENLATTLGAIIATEPLLMWQFNRISLIAPVVNILVLPLIPLAMGFGFMNIFVHALWPVTDALLRLILGVIQGAAAAPFAAHNLSGLSLVGAGLLCSFIFVTCVIRSHAQTSVVAE